MDVAIVGVGLHPFGRFAGRDRRSRWARSRSAARSPTPASSGATSSSRSAGSYEVDNPDAVVALLGLTGIPFTDVYNGCATAASALDARRATRSGSATHDLGIAVGMDKHLPGAFSADPRAVRVPVVVRRGRPVPHDEVLRHEDQQVHARPRHLARDARQGRGEELPQRRAQPERVPAQAAVGGGDPRLADAQLPAHAVHVLQPRRRRGRGRAVPGRARAPLHRHADLPARDDGADPAARRVRGAQPVAADRARPSARRSTRRAPRTRWRASGPRTST